MTPTFALSVSNALPPELLASRIESVRSLSESIPSLRSICVRDDAMEPMLLSLAAVLAEGTGLRVILESADPLRLAAGAGSLDSQALLLSPEGDQEVLYEVASATGSAVAVSSARPQLFQELIGKAEDAGCPDIVLHPIAPSMKGCLESTVHARRVSDLPVMSRAWSGEYALAVSSVSFMRGGSLAVLDDLDPQACAVLDSVARNLSGPGFETT
ncbi:MAG: hypothetical protein Q4Q62_04165 [Thermoplasmata archaeon]|nr:hypothetical protein [Thermoplasmata archaeon]